KLTISKGCDLRLSVALNRRRRGKLNEAYDDCAISSQSAPPGAAASRAGTRRKLVAAPLAGNCFDCIWNPGLHLAGPDAAGTHSNVGRLRDRRRRHRAMGGDFR